MASILYGLAGKLLGELCSPVFQDYVGKPWGLGTNDEFDKLSNTLSAIAAVLLDAEEKQRTNHQVRDWLMKIKPVFYDVEDLLQEITYESLKRQVMTRNKRAKEVHIFFSSSNQVKYRLKMGRKVKLIREELNAIALDSNRFGLVERNEEMHVVRSNIREETHSFVSRENVIGRDEDIQSVTKLLLESDDGNHVSVTSIVGIGGLGKTTLAQSVYNTEEVKKHFELMMWVCVSEFFDVKLICEKIIESATEQKCETLQMYVVKAKLKRVIDGKKYLLVLDDVWNENTIAWMNLVELLFGGGKGSKILVTTRTKLVARVAKSRDVHSLKGLSREDSWVLFKQAAFKQGVEPESSIIVDIGKEVVEICAGVPLAIKVIGSVLGVKEKELDWLDFRKNDLPSITQDSKGTILPILKLSYDYLPAPVKRCFAYCAIFPKDWEINKTSLIRMWMAHGLIQSDGTPRSLEDMGDKYFIDLVDRSLIFEGFYNRVYRRPNFYKMHDLVHDLAQFIGGNEYCNLDADVCYIDGTTRHAWTSQHLTANLRHAKKLRTLVVVLPFDMDRRVIKEIMTMFKKVRVLVMNSLEITSIPHFTDGLRHLSYLDLSFSNFELLPECICSLYNLQTLLLFLCKNLKELPTRTRNLVSLRHLEIYGCFKLTHMPCGMEELTSLHKLNVFVMGPEDKKCGKLGELKYLVNLRGELCIRNLRGSKVVNSKRSQSYYPSPLTQLKFLQSLMLEWNNEEFVEEEEAEELLLSESLKPHPNLERLYIEGYGGKRFPSWMDKVRIGVCLPNIVNIAIYNCKSWRHVSQFGLLPSLESLSLSSMDDMEHIHEELESASTSSQGSGFPTPKAPDQLFSSLKKLHLRSMRKLRRLMCPKATSRLNNRYFPVLEELEIKNCPLFEVDGSVTLGLQTLIFSLCNNIVTLPEWTCDLTSLQEISLRHCKSLASIPECMRRLSSLQRLEVGGASPELLERCEMETGEDWHNIAHIPNISFEKNSGILHTSSGLSGDAHQTLRQLVSESLQMSKVEKYRETQHDGTNGIYEEEKEGRSGSRRPRRGRLYTN